MINLNFKTIKIADEDLDGLNFYVREGNLFWAEDFAEAYGLNKHEISADDVHAVQDATGHLNPGESLEVTYEVNADA